jgi:hypothetical protein
VVFPFGFAQKYIFISNVLAYRAEEPDALIVSKWLINVLYNMELSKGERATRVVSHL